jgi:hypothetical protein
MYMPIERADHDADRLAEQLRFWRRSISKHKWSALALALAIGLLTTLDRLCHPADIPLDGNADARIQQEQSGWNRRSL